MARSVDDGTMDDVIFGVDGDPINALMVPYSLTQQHPIILLATN